MASEKESRVSSVLTAESIRVIGETVGVSGLSDEAASFLAEDISYRLKLLVQVGWWRLLLHLYYSSQKNKVNERVHFKFFFSFFTLMGFAWTLWLIISLCTNNKIGRFFKNLYFANKPLQVNRAAFVVFLNGVLVFALIT